MSEFSDNSKLNELASFSSMHYIAPSVPRHSHPDLDQSAGHICTSALSLALSALAFPAVALTSRKLQRALLAVVVLNISWQIQKHFFLREDVADLGSLGGLQASLGNIALAGLYVAWLIESVTRRGSRDSVRRHLSAVTVSAALFLLFNAVSLLVASDATLGAFEVVSVLERFLLYIYIANKVSSREDVLFILRILLIGLIIQSVLMLAQAAGLIQTIDWNGIKARTDFAGDPRVSGTLGSPNPAAAYLAMNMTFAFAVLLSGVGRVDKCLSSVGLFLALLPLLFTSSRGGWLSFLAGFITVLLVSRSRAPRTLVAITVVALIFVATSFVGPVGERLVGDDRGSAAARMPLNHLALAMIEEHPMLGVGSNNFSVAMQPYLAHAFTGDFVYTVHNTYLCVWAETGIGGLIAFVWFLFSVLYRALRVWLLRDYALAFMSLGCAAAIMGFMIQMNFDPFRSGGASHLIWLFGGLVTVMYRLSRKSLILSSTSMSPVIRT
jgi:O-antigen ligase